MLYLQLLGDLFLPKLVLYVLLIKRNKVGKIQILM